MSVKCVLADQTGGDYLPLSGGTMNGMIESTASSVIVVPKGQDIVRLKDDGSGDFSNAALMFSHLSNQQGIPAIWFAKEDTPINYPLIVHGIKTPIQDFDAANKKYVDDSVPFDIVTKFVIGTSTAGWTENDCDYLCDGTNDEEEINAAIQALPSDSRGEIVIREGTYNISSSIIINKSCTISGANKEKTILKRQFNYIKDYEGIVILSEANYIVVNNLSIDGNKDSYTSNSLCNLIIKNNSNYNKITNNIFLNTSGSGVKLSGNNSIISNNICNNTVAIGIGVYGRNNICMNNYSASSSTGIEVYGYYNIITNNQCRNSYYGIAVRGGNYNCIIGNNCSNNTHYGIYTYNVYYNYIINNVCNENSESGIRLDNFNYSVANGNITQKNTSYGLYVIASSDSMINNNSATQNSIANLYFMGGNRCQIDGNFLPKYPYADQQYTIYVGTNGKNNVFSNNVIFYINYTNNGTNNTFVNNVYVVNE